MKRKTLIYCFTLWAVFLAWGLSPAMAEENRKFKVLVVMSYEEDYSWSREIREGVESVLSGNSELRYVYLNTRRSDPDASKTKAEEAYELYQEFKPDGVIASDDNAQSLFVIPYLKDKVKTPIMFNGVNVEPQEYGYPTPHISGILERVHYIESIAFIQQIVPSVKTVGYLWGNNATAKGFHQQAQKEMDTYSAKSAAFTFADTFDQAMEMTNKLKTQCDAIFIDLVRGIRDKDGTPMNEKEVTSALIKNFGKPVLTANAYMMKYGALCAVVKTGQEQGAISAEMLLKAMQGTPVPQIPITRNYKGKRMINVSVLKELGIMPRPEILGSAELVRTEN